jgi:hypothetical protein
MCLHSGCDGVPCVRGGKGRPVSSSTGGLLGKLVMDIKRGLGLGGWALRLLHMEGTLS